MTHPISLMNLQYYISSKYSLLHYAIRMYNGIVFMVLSYSTLRCELQVLDSEWNRRTIRRTSSCGEI